MSATNGSVRKITIGRKGLIEFSFGDSGTPFVVDVIDTNNQWTAIDREHRNAEGQVPPENRELLNNACWGFVREIAVAKGVPEQEVFTVTLAEACEFMKWITEEAIRLQDFFVPRSVKDEPSSPTPSTTVRFST